MNRIFLFLSIAIVSTLLQSCASDIIGRWALDHEKTFSIPWDDNDQDPSLVMKISDKLISISTSDGQMENHNYSLADDGTGIVLVEGSCSGRSFSLLEKEGPWLVLRQRQCADYPSYCEQLTANEPPDLKSERFDEKDPPLYFRLLSK